MAIKKLAVILSHPIQYYSPFFQLLSQTSVFQLKVFYTLKSNQYGFDVGFGKKVEWDIPLLEGYDYCFVYNTSKTAKGFAAAKNPSLINDIEQWGAEILLVYGWNYHSHLQSMRYFKGKLPVWFRGDSTLLDAIPLHKKVLRTIWLRYVYSFIDKALYVGSASKDYFTAFGCKPNQLLCVPHAIDNQRFGTVTDVQQQFIDSELQKMNIHYHQKRILFCGKFQSKKNPLLLLRAFKLLNPADTHLIMVGNGALEDELKAEAAYTENIHFLPFQNQQLMPAVYRLANIFCLPSSGPGETWGLAVNEAMACGRVVVVSNACGCATDLVHEGINGFIFQRDDLNSLIAALKKAIQANTDAMGLESHQLIQDWSFNKQVQILEEAV